MSGRHKTNGDGHSSRGNSSHSRRGGDGHDSVEGRDSRRQSSRGSEQEKPRKKESERDKDRNRDHNHREHHRDRSTRDDRGKNRSEDYDRHRSHDYDRNRDPDHDRGKDRRHRRRSRSRSKDRSKNRSESPSKSKRASGFDMAPTVSPLPGAPIIGKNENTFVSFFIRVDILQYCRKAVLQLLIIICPAFLLFVKITFNCFIRKLRILVMLLAVVCVFLSVIVFCMGKKAMLSYMSHGASQWRDNCRYYVQRGISALVCWILFAFNRKLFHFGQMPGIPQSMPGMFSAMSFLAPLQFGSGSLMPLQMTQQATRHARRVYVGGLPPLANEQTIATFFSRVMTAIGGNTSGPGDAVVNVYINHEKKFAFVEMRSVEEASNAMALDGIIFEGVSVRVRRPTDYNPALAATLGSSEPSPHLNLAAVGLSYGAIGGAEGPDRIFVGGLPYYFTDAQIRELLESFGPLRGFDLVKDRETGNSKGYGFCVYQDPAVTDIACAALNGLKMGDKTLTVRRATASVMQIKPEQELILQQAQQYIAQQKMALQAAGIALPPSPPVTSPSKVLCLTEVVSENELREDDEYEEILEDMREESAKFGPLVNVVIPRPSPSGEETPGVGKVFLEYADHSGSSRAMAALHGRKFGGNVVTAVYYPEEKFCTGDYGEIVTVN